MSFVLTYSPGQLATLVFETLNDEGERSDGYDGYSLPIVSRIIFPNLSLAVGFPQSFSRLDVGLFIFNFKLPIMASAIGTYIADIAYIDPDNGNPKNTFFQIICTAPYGNFSASTI